MTIPDIEYLIMKGIEKWESISRERYNPRFQQNMEYGRCINKAIREQEKIVWENLLHGRMS